MAHGAVFEPSLWPLVTGIYPIPSAGSVYDDLVLFLHAFTPLITFGLIRNSFHFACFVNSSLRFLIPNLHPICTCSCLFTPLTEGRSARDLTQAATSQKKSPLCSRHPSPAGKVFSRQAAHFTFSACSLWSNGVAFMAYGPYTWAIHFCPTMPWLSGHASTNIL